MLGCVNIKQKGYALNMKAIDLEGYGMTLQDMFIQLAKLTYYPIKYRRGEGYDVESYWKDRFSRHGMAFRGVGNEGIDEQRNRLL